MSIDDPFDEEGKQNRTSQLGRRGFLGALGATAAAGSIGGLVSAAEPTDPSRTSPGTIRVPAGERRRLLVSDRNAGGSIEYVGSTLENTLIDVTAEGAGLRIEGRGSDWAIRNVGIMGRSAGDSKVLRVTADENGTGLVENVYLGDGSPPEGNVGLFVPLDHAGKLLIRRCNLQNWPNNGIYASAPGIERDGNNGIVRIENCYAKNNNIASYRIGTDGSYVYDSVVHVDGEVPSHFGGMRNARGIWVRDGGSASIYNCDVLLEHPNAAHGVSVPRDSGPARVYDSAVVARDGAAGRVVGPARTGDIGTVPDVSLPPEVPATALDAAEGSLPNQIAFENPDAESTLRYMTLVTGAIQSATLGSTGSEEPESGSATDASPPRTTSAVSAITSGAPTIDLASANASTASTLVNALRTSGVSSELLDVHRALADRSTEEGTVFNIPVGDLGPIEVPVTVSVDLLDAATGVVGGVSADRSRGTEDRSVGDRSETEYWPEPAGRPTENASVRPNGSRSSNSSASGTSPRSPDSSSSFEGADPADTSRPLTTVGPSADAYRFAGDLQRLILSLGDEESTAVAIDVDRSSGIISVRGGSSLGYELSATGTIEAIERPEPTSPDQGGSSESDTSTSGENDAPTEVADDVDRFAYTGEFESITFENGARVTVERSHTLSIRTDAEAAVDYQFSASGAVRALGDRTDPSSEAGAAGRSARGTVRDGIDRYEYVGTLTEFGAEGDPAVSIDGRAVLPQSLGRDTLTIDGTGVETEYTFRALGGLGPPSEQAGAESTTEAPPKLERTDSERPADSRPSSPDTDSTIQTEGIAGRTATGYVDDERDRFSYADAILIEGFDVGDATAMLTGNSEE